jgi:hypothetical protein
MIIQVCQVILDKKLEEETVDDDGGISGKGVNVNSSGKSLVIDLNIELIIIKKYIKFFYFKFNHKNKQYNFI